MPEELGVFTFRLGESLFSEPVRTWPERLEEDCEFTLELLLSEPAGELWAEV